MLHAARCLRGFGAHFDLIFIIAARVLRRIMRDQVRKPSVGNLIKGYNQGAHLLLFVVAN